MSAEQIEYKREQATMDQLLRTLKTIVHLDEQLSASRQRSTYDQLENELVDQLIAAAGQLNDPGIDAQIRLRTDPLQSEARLHELRSIVLPGSLMPVGGRCSSY
jgi:hypothetical protein